MAGEDALPTDKAEAWFLEQLRRQRALSCSTPTAPTTSCASRATTTTGATTPPIAEIVIDETADAVSQAQMLQSGAADIAMQIDPDTAKTIDQRGRGDRDGAVLQFHLRRLQPRRRRPTRCRSPRRCARPSRSPSTTTASSSSPSAARASRRLRRSPTAFPAPPTCRCPSRISTRPKQLLAEAGLADGFELDVVVAALNVYGVDLPLLMQKVQQDLARVNVRPTSSRSLRRCGASRSSTPGIPFTARFYAPDYFGSAQYVYFFGMIEDSFWLTNASGGGTVGSDQSSREPSCSRRRSRPPTTRSARRSITRSRWR